MIEACPECDASNIELNSPGGISGPKGTSSKRYRCHDCGTHFDEPIKRKPLSSRNAGRSGLSKKLMEADPEEWP